MARGENIGDSDHIGPAADAGRLTEGATRAPVPAWVELAPYDIPVTADPHFIANGSCMLLDDSQVDLCGSERAWFSRRAELITANVGAERAANFEAAFDPAYERLEIHGVRVLRGAEVIDYTHAPGFEVLRRERNLERLQYDGRLSVHFTLPDVRVGDVVEFMLTTYGMRRALKNKHGAWIGFEWESGIVEVRHRLRTPDSKIVRTRAVNNPPSCEESSADGVLVRKWRAQKRRGVKFEGQAPPWVLQRAEVQFSEWKDWAEVADTFAPLYVEDQALPAALEQEVQRIADLEPSPAGRAAAVLRFVQGAVRYLAISIGEGGFTPRSIADIFQTRYGDCKDKARLFTAMARKLGIQACPALVNTAEGMALDEWLPTGVAFNHCIVRAEIDGKVYWLDPTRSLQPSPLDRVSQCHFGWALPMRDGVTALERMPDPALDVLQTTHERVTLGDRPEQAVRYQWRTTTRRGRAEWVRDHVAREGAVGMFRAYAQDITRAFPKAAPVRQDLESDNIADNEITAIEVYDIPDAWMKTDGTRYEFSTYDLVMKSQLAPLEAGSPKHPIYLRQIGKLSRKVEIESAAELRFSGWSRTHTCTGVVFKNEFRKEGPRSYVLEQSLDISAFTTPAAEADAYRALISELEKSDVLISDAVNKKGLFTGADGSEERSWLNAPTWEWVARAAILLVLGAYWFWRLNQ